MIAHLRKFPLPNRAELRALFDWTFDGAATAVLMIGGLAAYGFATFA